LFNSQLEFYKEAEYAVFVSDHNIRNRII